MCLASRHIYLLNYLLLFLIANIANAVELATLDVGIITGRDWKLEGVKLELGDLNQPKPQFRMSATKLTLPKPFNDLALAHIHCIDFTWDHEEIKCSQGSASVRSAYWQSPTTKFSFHLGPKFNSFKLEDARLAGSCLSLNLETNADNWQAKFSAKQVNNKLVDKLVQASAPKPQSTKQKPANKKSGTLSLSGTVSGKQTRLQAFSVIAEVEGLTDQAEDGKVATEKLNLLTRLDGKRTKGNVWDWQSESSLLAGALYVDPVYLEAGSQPITLSGEGWWDNLNKKVNIQSFSFRHPERGLLKGRAEAYYRNGIKVDKADVILQSETLQGLLNTYINPFFTESPLYSVSVSGDMLANFSFIKDALSDTSINFSKLQVNDKVGRLAIKEGNGTVNWSADPMQAKRSDLAWQGLTLKGLPLETAKLQFTSQGNHFSLAEKVKLPLLGGSITVDKFSWQSKKQDEPDVSFAGSVDNVSLDALSKTLGWTPLSGKIGGRIPGVDYHDKTLSLDGGLSIAVFDGNIKVNHLAATGLFTDFPKVSGDIDVENLDLDQLTRKFEFGNITGRLTGFVNKLVLENWHPVTFFAWLGTPDDDDSTHRISQKAVKNIASIGGGGASDLLSRSFLGFFETFGYDKIGIGCYLHNGVCQMMGLEAAGPGYYLIKGGGLPRIDVLGYNTQVNWDVLVERLGRVVTTDKVIVQ